jgi:quinoprotein glucose dehydrogenase
MQRIVIGFGVAALISAALLAQNGPKPGDGDWPLYSRDLAGTKYSPLAQITPGNVARLTEAWSVRLVPPAAARRGGAAPAALE